MSARMQVEALSVAAFATILSNLPRDTRATVTATENGTPWATVKVSPLTDTARSAFPCYADGVTGDTERRTGHRGAIVRGADTAHALTVIIDRARRMAKSEAHA